MNFKNVNWPGAIFITGYHLLLVALLPVYFYFFVPSMGIILTMIGLWFLTGITITAGYHRLFSHNSYKAHPIIEKIFLVLGLLSTQGSALRWSFDHRLHHSHIDQDQDPYAVKDGFWHAHIWWMFRKERPLEKKIVADLYRSKAVVFQHKHYALLMLGANLITTLALGWMFGDMFGAFVFLWLMRTFLLHHCTWFINSLAHYWGHKNYSVEHSAVDNYIISMLTFGEGYHNYHHTFAHDYRNGIRWYHFDPTKWLIWTLSKLGLARNLKEMKEAKIREKMIIAHKSVLLEKLKTVAIEKKDEMREYIAHISEELIEKSKKLASHIDMYKKEQSKSLKKELSHLKRVVQKNWKEWKSLNKRIMNLPEAVAA